MSQFCGRVSWACRAFVFVTGLIVFAALSSSAKAAIFQGTYTGVTVEGSTLNGNPISVGTPFTVKAVFSPSLSDPTAQGARRFGAYVTATINAIDYTAPGYYTLDLLDGTNTVLGGAHAANLTNTPDSISGFTGFYPGYTSATPAFSVDDVSPTVFTPYYASLSASLPIATSSGDALVLQYDGGPASTGSVGVQFEITAVPEPATLGLLALSSAMVLKRRRRD